MSDTPIQTLVNVMARLRDPQKGCPWDLEQNFQTIAPHTLEETYELVEAIEQNDPKAIKDELGDLLFQVVFHVQMAREAGLFDLQDVAQHVADKMIERHPHVFGDRDAATAGAVLVNWESDKAAKRAKQAADEGRGVSALDGVSTALPATTRAVKLQNRAARVGFDWSNPGDVLAKIREEADELKAEMNGPPNQDALEDELGDLFFALINLARKLKIDPESALRRTNRKFDRRFRAMESRLAAEGRDIAKSSLDDMENLWSAIKAEEKAAKKIA
jgi:ATP diphosphatase